MKTIRDIEYLEGVKVLVRADFNVINEQGKIADDFRISVALPTIKFLSDKGAVIILVSHSEANDGSNQSLKPVADYLNTKGLSVEFVKDFKNARAAIDLARSKIFLLENLRFFDGEKNNDKQFAQELASLADIYVNEAFPVSHRAHASIVGVPKLLPSYAGLQFAKEITELSKAFNPTHPFLFILGGAKFATKMPLIEKFAQVADSVFIGGALANDLLKAQGKEVGVSTVSNTPMDLSSIVSNPKIFSYADAHIMNDGVKDVGQVSPGDKIADIGEKTAKILEEKIMAARFILWNGPFGIYEEGFTWGTEECARLISENTQAVKIVGGGDTLAAIAKLGVEDKFTFVSSGGGAMLDFLAKGTSLGLEALNASQVV